MNRMTFNEVVHRVPNLAAEGLLVVNESKYTAKRHEFVTNALHLQEAIDASNFLSKIGKSSRFSQWQRNNCSPENLKPLLEWHIGRPLSSGSIIVAALHLGFTMGVTDGTQVYFNFFAPQIETELAQLRTLQQIKRVVGA
ncbi:MAG: hypothetical protein EOP07_11505 [Proteobacteria bacterium]|nr:MAG: hypothetical protein EOP07_11505 [Pseudomonadota bacterium]